MGPEPAAAEKRKSLNHTELLTAPKSCCTTGLERLKLLNAQTSSINGLSRQIPRPSQMKGRGQREGNFPAVYGHSGVL